MSEQLPVIFRAERTGTFKGHVTAVFPTLPYDQAGTLLTTYAHVGQHGSGSRSWYRHTRAAKPSEYASLLQELQQVYNGYTLRVCKRMPARR